jgi:hypothetical protein
VEGDDSIVEHAHDLSSLHTVEWHDEGFSGHAPDGQELSSWKVTTLCMQSPQL